MAVISIHVLMTSTSPIHGLSFLSSGSTLPTISRIIAYKLFKMNMSYTFFPSPDSTAHSIKFSVNDLTINLASKLEILVFSSAPSFSHMISNESIHVNSTCQHLLNLVLSPAFTPTPTTAHCFHYMPTNLNSRSTFFLYHPSSYSKRLITTSGCLKTSTDF